MSQQRPLANGCGGERRKAAKTAQQKREPFASASGKIKQRRQLHSEANIL